MTDGQDKRRKRQPVAVRWRMSPEPTPPEAWRAAQRVFARLAARAYVLEHPELLGAEGAKTGGEPPPPGAGTGEQVEPCEDPRHEGRGSSACGGTANAGPEAEP